MGEKSWEAVPILRRPWDVVLVGVLAMFLAIAVMVDVVSALAPVGRAGVPGVRPETMAWFFWIPSFVKEQYLWWCDACDPAFCYNPAWMKAMAAFSPFLYVPFYLVALPSVLFGWERIRLPMLLWAYGLFLTLTVILFEEAYGEHASHNFALVFAGNAPYWLLPFAIFWRFRNRHCFSRRRTGKPKNR